LRKKIYCFGKSTLVCKRSAGEKIEREREKEKERERETERKKRDGGNKKKR